MDWVRVLANFRLANIWIPALMGTTACGMAVAGYGMPTCLQVAGCSKIKIVMSALADLDGGDTIRVGSCSPAHIRVRIRWGRKRQRSKIKVQILNITASHKYIRCRTAARIFDIDQRT